jgi:hypothetical protein
VVLRTTQTSVPEPLYRPSLLSSASKSGLWRGGWFAGLAPTGKKVEVAGVDICRIEGGKIAEYLLYADILSMMRQLGMIPKVGQA